MKSALVLLSLIAALVISLLVEVLPASSFTQSPSAPTLIFPANGAEVTATSIVFEWEPTPDATKYWLQVNTDPAWGKATRVFYEEVSATSQMVTGFPCNGTTYYWRVHAGNDYGWSTPSARSFISVSLPPPQPPNLIYPGDGATVGGNSILFEWEASADATQYWLQVNTDPAWGKTTRLFYAAVQGTSQMVDGFPNPPANGPTYYWRVHAGNSWGWSTPSSRSFVNLGPPVPGSPVLVYPNNEEMMTDPSITFQWQATDTATKYWLDVNRDPNFGKSTRFFYGYVGDITSKTLTGFPLNGTIYYWRVTAGSVQGWGTPSSRTFNMLHPPTAPTPISPENGAIDVPYQSITFTWTAPPLSTTYWNWISINTDPNCSKTTRAVYTQVSGTSYTATNLNPSTTYYWRAYAGNAAGWSSPSNILVFTTAALLIPATPTLSLPTNGAIVGGADITFQWSAVDGATKYWLHVNTDPAWGKTTRFFYADVGAITSKTVSGFPNIGTTYYWKVWAGNDYGWSAPTSPWSVINGSGPPLAPTLVSPGNGTIVSGTSIIYQWSTSANTEKYWLLVSTNSDVHERSAYKYSADVGNITQYVDTGYPNNGTTYYWWVWAGNNAGWSSNSQVMANGQHFINGSIIPTPSTTSTPAVTPTPPPLPPPLEPTPTPTPTPIPTSTPEGPPPPEDTPTPTLTPTPVETPLPPPDNTPTPTPTPTPVELPPPADIPTPTPTPTLTPTSAPAPGGGGGTSYIPTPTPTLTLTPTPTPTTVPLPPTPVTTLIPFVVSISVTAPSNSVEIGATLQLTAKAIYSDSSTADITGNATWASSDDTVAIVSPSGLVTGVGHGISQITATLEGITGTFEIMVTPVAIPTPTATPAPTPQTGVAAVPWFMITGIIIAALVLSLVCLLLWRRFFWKKENQD